MQLQWQVVKPNEAHIFPDQLLMQQPFISTVSCLIL
jgi:hypothetical protein